AAGAFGAIHAARARGTQVWGETRPIYLGVTSACYAEGGVGATKTVGAPPIRDVSHQQALWQALQAGDLHAVGSDHTTWTPTQKAFGVDDFTRVRYGVPGLKTEMCDEEVSLEISCIVTRERPGQTTHRYHL